MKYYRLIQNKINRLISTKADDSASFNNGWHIKYFLLFCGNDIRKRLILDTFRKGFNGWHKNKQIEQDVQIKEENWQDTWSLRVRCKSHSPAHLLHLLCRHYARTHCAYIQYIYSLYTILFPSSASAINKCVCVCVRRKCIMGYKSAEFLLCCRLRAALLRGKNRNYTHTRFSPWLFSRSHRRHTEENMRTHFIVENVRKRHLWRPRISLRLFQIHKNKRPTERRAKSYTELQFVVKICFKKNDDSLKRDADRQEVNTRGRNPYSGLKLDF